MILPFDPQTARDGDQQRCQRCYHSQQLHDPKGQVWGTIRSGGHKLNKSNDVTKEVCEPSCISYPHKSSQITLDSVQTLQNYQHVSVKANVDPKVQLDCTNKTLLWQMQQEHVESHSGKMIIIGRLEEDTSYQLDNFVINVKYLSPQKTDSPCDIHAIADIGTTEPLSSHYPATLSLPMQKSLECHTLEHIGTHNA